MTKKEQRQLLIQQLRNFDARKRASQSAELYRQLFNSAVWQAAQSVGVVLSMPIELDTAPIIKQAIVENKQVNCPKTDRGFQMKFVDYATVTKFTTTKFGVKEPLGGDVVTKNKIDLLIVPGLAYASEQRARLGFGGGYYDRYLADYSGETVILLFNFQLFQQATWPVSDVDIAINNVIVAEEN